VIPGRMNSFAYRGIAFVSLRIFTLLLRAQR